MISLLEATASELSLVEREMSIQATEKEPVLLLKVIADKYKTQEIYGNAVELKRGTFCF